MLSLTSKAEALWNVNEIYFLGEYLHSARYDYEGGVYLRFKKGDVELNSAKPISPKDCFPIKGSEIVEVIEESLESYLEVFPDEEFDFYYALDLLQQSLDRVDGLKACRGRRGLHDVYDSNTSFLLSYKQIHF